MLSGLTPIVLLFPETKLARRSMTVGTNHKSPLLPKHARASSS